ncbi:6800_t:CDS:10, partial [Acaulospora colombiana]
MQRSTLSTYGRQPRLVAFDTRIPLSKEHLKEHISQEQNILKPSIGQYGFIASIDHEANRKHLQMSTRSTYIDYDIVPNPIESNPYGVNGVAGAPAPYAVDMAARPVHLSLWTRPYPQVSAMPSFLARLLHSFLGDWATKDRKASNATAYPGNSTSRLEAAPLLALLVGTRANPRPMDQCDDPGLFQTMSTQTRTYTSKESTVTSVNTVIFTETNQTARPIELPPPPFTSLPEAPTPTIRPPLAPDDSPYTNPTRPTGTQSLQAQPTPNPQAGAQENSPSGINTEVGSNMSTLSTRYIDGSGTIQGSGSSESPSVNNLPYVYVLSHSLYPVPLISLSYRNGSRKNDNKTAFQISTPAGVIIGITAGLVIAGLLAFSVYRYRSSRRRAGFSSQEKLISKKGIGIAVLAAGMIFLISLLRGDIDGFTSQPKPEFKAVTDSACPTAFNGVHTKVLSVAAPVKYRLACDAIDWVFYSEDPYFKVYIFEGDASTNFAYLDTSLALFATANRVYHYTVYPEL